MPMTPGPIFHARYGEPVLVRMINDLPPVGTSKVTFALPSTTIHLHNGHTASESDGNPQDWIDSGEFWDHQYGNFPSGHNPDEKLFWHLDEVFIGSTVGTHKLALDVVPGAHRLTILDEHGNMVSVGFVGY